MTAPAVVPADVPSEEESAGDLVGADIYVDIDEETGEFVPGAAPMEVSAVAEAVSPGVVPPDAPPLSDSESEPDDPVAPGQPSLLWPPRILDGYPCPLLNYSDQPELDSGIRPAKAAMPSTQDIALIEEVDKSVPEVFNKALAGSFRERTLRCLFDITGTFPDRLGGRTLIAKGPCRSLAEEPSRRADLPRAVSAPRSFGPSHEAVIEETDEEGDTEQIPVTHAWFIRGSEVATLPQAPYHRREKSDPN
ncbi:MAG: hypothetical protein ACKPKO_63130, partial [Candidatus Fonsibacter sp.]